MTAISDRPARGNAESRLPTFLRFADLKRMRIVGNYTTLLRWIASGDFPPGRMLGPNTPLAESRHVASRWFALMQLRL